MLRAVEKLTAAAFAGIQSMTIGNHSFTKEKDIFVFRYHWSEICTVDPVRRYVFYDDCGFKTSSTTRSINSYKEMFRDYEEVNRTVFDNLKGVQPC